MLKTLFDQEYYAKWYSQHINYPNIKEEHCLEVKGGGLCFPLGRGDPLLLIVKWIGFCTSYFWEMRQIEDENVCKSNSIRKEKPFKNNCVPLQHFPKSPHFHSDVQNCRRQFRDYFGIKQVMQRKGFDQIMYDWMSVSTDAVDPCNDDLVREKFMLNLTILMS